MTTTGSFLLGLILLVAASLGLFFFALRKALLLEDCRNCGRLCDEGHSVCAACRAKHEANPQDLHKLN